MTLHNIDLGPSHWTGTALPGQPGNTVFAGHRITNSHPFRHLDQLVAGDEVIFTVDGVRSVYRVTGSMVVGPDETWIADQTPDATGTLYACHPPGSLAYRYVVKLALAARALGRSAARRGATRADRSLDGHGDGHDRPATAMASRAPRKARMTTRAKPVRTLGAGGGVDPLEAGGRGRGHHRRHAARVLAGARPGPDRALRDEGVAGPARGRGGIGFSVVAVWSGWLQGDPQRCDDRDQHHGRS